MTFAEAMMRKFYPRRPDIFKDIFSDNRLEDRLRNSARKNNKAKLLHKCETKEMDVWLAMSKQVYNHPSKKYILTVHDENGMSNEFRRTFIRTYIRYRLLRWKYKMYEVDKLADAL